MRGITGKTFKLPFARTVLLFIIVFCVLFAETPFLTGAEAATLRDEFNAVAYDGSDGTADWSATPWVEMWDDTFCYWNWACVWVDASDPSDLYLAMHSYDLNDYHYIYRPANLSGATSATLSFDYVGDCASNPDGMLRVDVSDDGGANCTTLQEFVIGDAAGSKSYTLESAISLTANVRIYFWFHGAVPGNQQIHIDNVQIDYSSGETLSGRVFEDADFAGTAADYDGGTNDLALANVDVELYTSSNTYITSTATNASGNYSFTGLSDGTYKVRVRSATIGDSDTLPSGSLNATVPGTWPYPLPEMIWGNGTAMYGGQNVSVDDTATGDNAGPGDTYVTVTVSGAEVSGVDFGYSYNLIVQTVDDANAGNVRSKQGSLRQFIKIGRAHV